jgi:hypothetical protein
MSEQKQRPSPSLAEAAVALDTLRGEYATRGADVHVEVTQGFISKCVSVMHRSADHIEELEAEKVQLKDKADAYDILQWLISEGHHDFRWDYDCDTEIVTLESSGLTVETSLHELGRDSVATTLRMLKALAEPRKRSDAAAHKQA